MILSVDINVWILAISVLDLLGGVWADRKFETELVCKYLLCSPIILICLDILF